MLVKSLKGLVRLQLVEVLAPQVKEANQLRLAILLVKSVN